MQISKGDTVAWDWGQGTAEGKVTRVYTRKITRKIKGTEVTRHASDAEPAFLIEQDDGTPVLKSCTELRAA